MTAAADNKGVPARPEPDHSATRAPGLPAVPPQPSEAVLPDAFRRALAAGAPKGGVAPPPPKGAKAIADRAQGQAKGPKPGVPQNRTPRHANISPRSGHK